MQCQRCGAVHWHMNKFNDTCIDMQTTWMVAVVKTGGRPPGRLGVRVVAAPKRYTNKTTTTTGKTPNETKQHTPAKCLPVVVVVVESTRCSKQNLFFLLGKRCWSISRDYGNQKTASCIMGTRSAGNAPGLVTLISYRQLQLRCVRVAAV